MGSILISCRRWWLSVAPALVFAGGAAADSGADYRQQGAHAHGVADLNLAVQADQVVLELRSPAENLIGFEHQPRSDAERATIDRAVALLRNGERLFRLSPGARCELVDARVESPLLDHENGAAAVEPNEAGHRHRSSEDPDLHAETHAELLAAYRFRCARPDALKQLEVGLFEAFPATEQLRVQAVTDRGQTAGELTASSPVLGL
jgi:hypothetical protein